MVDNFTKSDLKNGMIVELRNGNRYMVVGTDLLGLNGYMGLCSYNKDLLKYDSTSTDPDWDIVKVYKNIYHLDLKKANCIVWEREEVKEVTMAEVEEKFGCRVKIVKD